MTLHWVVCKVGVRADVKVCAQARHVHAMVTGGREAHHLAAHGCDDGGSGSRGARKHLLDCACVGHARDKRGNSFGIARLREPHLKLRQQRVAVEQVRHLGERGARQRHQPRHAGQQRRLRRAVRQRDHHVFAVGERIKRGTQQVCRLRLVAARHAKHCDCKQRRRLVAVWREVLRHRRPHLLLARLRRSVEAEAGRFPFRQGLLFRGNLARFLARCRHRLLLRCQLSLERVKLSGLGSRASRAVPHVVVLRRQEVVERVEVKRVEQHRRVNFSGGDKEAGEPRARARDKHDIGLVLAGHQAGQGKRLGRVAAVRQARKRGVALPGRLHRGQQVIVVLDARRPHRQWWEHH
mmetsp:Transcript_32258/g.96315  ORF Transcript_32258/g.96315 Transcript_32258/m.96315 type:complete len:351 (+) Transcript_32258:1223-2275(+)